MHTVIYTWHFHPEWLQCLGLITNLNSFNFSSRLCIYLTSTSRSVWSQFLLYFALFYIHGNGSNNVAWICFVCSLLPHIIFSYYCTFPSLYVFSNVHSLQAANLNPRFSLVLDCKLTSSSDFRLHSSILWEQKSLNNENLCRNSGNLHTACIDMRHITFLPSVCVVCLTNYTFILVIIA